MKNSLLEQLAQHHRELIDHATVVATEVGAEVFLVGGPLRDLLLGNNLIDLDLVLERESELFARALAARCGGEVRAYPHFLTFKVEIPDRKPIDIATTRREVYEQPGALPTVAPASLKDDMARRDFTVNAMALSLRTGQIRDFWGGRADLEQRLIRVLHDQSFLDDPTRIFRSIRLATRLSFQIEHHTEELMRAALDQGATGAVSRERLWREVFLALNEPDRARVLSEFAQWGLMGLSLNQAMRTGEDLKRVDEYVRLLNADAPVAFLAILSARNLAGSGLSQKQIDSIRFIQGNLQHFMDRLNDLAERDAFARVREVSLEMLAVAAATEPKLDALLRRYRDFTLLQVGVRGDQLGVPGGPHIGRALERTREALFFGDIKPEQAAAFARQAAQEYLAQKAP